MHSRIEEKLKNTQQFGGLRLKGDKHKRRFKQGLDTRQVPVTKYLLGQCAGSKLEPDTGLTKGSICVISNGQSQGTNGVLVIYSPLGNGLIISSHFAR